LNTARIARPLFFISVAFGAIELTKARQNRVLESHRSRC
jgi:hypothetical protein